MTAVTALVGLAIAIGVVGVVVPVLPGLALAVAATVVYGFLDGWDATAVVAMVVIAVLAAGGTAAKYVMADRSSTRGGAPRRSLLWAAVGAVVGFFVIPVAGLAIGGVGILAVAEYARLGAWSPALRSTRTTLVGLGTGILLELAAALAIAAVWAAWVVIG